MRFAAVALLLPAALLAEPSIRPVTHQIKLDSNIPVPMRDGTTLYADVYRPVGDGRYPVLLTRTPYGKQRDGIHANLLDFARRGYAVVAQDVRGRFESEGKWDPFRFEAKDGYDTVEWAAKQPWSNGKVGLNGISYYAENQWQCAALQPKHLAAICTWEGAADFYRDMAHHGGIFCNGFTKGWSENQVYTLQHGRGSRGFRSRMTGDWVSGPLELTDEELGANRRNFYEDCLARKLDTDDYWQ